MKARCLVIRVSRAEKCHIATVFRSTLLVFNQFLRIASKALPVIEPQATA